MMLLLLVLPLLNNLFNNFIMWTFIAIAAAAVLGGVADYLITKDTNSQNAQLQKDLNTQQIESTEKINKENVDAQQAINEQNVELAKWSAEFNRESAALADARAFNYNSPVTRASRMVQAGLNPSMDNGSGTISTSSGGAASAPLLEAAKRVVPNLTLGHPMQAYDPSTGFSNIASAFQQISQAENTKVDTQERQLSMSAKLNKLLGEVDGLNIDNKTKAILKDHYKLQLDAMKDDYQTDRKIKIADLAFRQASIQKTINEAANQASQAFLNAKRVEFEKIGLDLKDKEIAAYIDNSLRSYKVQMAGLALRGDELDWDKDKYQQELAFLRTKFKKELHLKGQQLDVDKKKVNAMVKLFEKEGQLYSSRTAKTYVNIGTDILNSVMSAVSTVATRGLSGAASSRGTTTGYEKNSKHSFDYAPYDNTLNY